MGKSAPAKSPTTFTKCGKNHLYAYQQNAFNTLTTHFQHGQHGQILYMSMGMGKTLVSICHMITNFSDRKDQKMAVFGPPGLTSVDDEITKSYPNNSGAWKYYSYDKLNDVPDLKDTVCIFDECHLLKRALLQSGAWVANLKKLMRCQRALLLTGTLIYDNIQDLLVSLNVATGPERKFPTSEKKYRQQYYKLNKTRAVIQGWLVAAFTLQIAGKPMLTKMLDVADFYASNNTTYFNVKDSIVQSVLRHVPGFQRKVFGTTPFRVNPRYIISIMLYYIFMSPFSGLIPAILTIFVIKSKRKLWTLDTDKLFREIAPYFAAQSLQYNPVQQLRGVFEVTAPKELIGKIPVVTVKRVKLTYTKPQIQTFIRFTVDRLTPTEAKMIGLTQSIEDLAFEYRTHTPPTAEEFIRHGVLIGNLEYSADILQQIAEEYKELGKYNSVQVPVADEKDPEANTRAIASNSDMLLSQLPRINSKFARIVQIIGNTNPTKIVVYSQSEAHGLDNFKQFLSAHPLSEEYAQFDHIGDHKAKYAAKQAFNEDPAQKAILYLEPTDIEGVDGILNTDAMFILEPFANNAQLQQLRARVARKGSHPGDVKKVTIYEFCMSMTFVQKHLFNFPAFQEWLRNQSEVLYTMRDFIFQQSVTPDELAVEKQAEISDLERNFKAYMRKQPPTPSLPNPAVSPSESLP